MSGKKRVYFAVSLVALSAVVYSLHWLLFGDLHHILIYLVGDIAFVPLEVLLVTLIIHKMIEHWQKKALLSRLNMVIGAFFSEVGTTLLKRFVTLDGDSERISRALMIRNDWTAGDFRQASRETEKLVGGVVLTPEALSELHELLSKKRGFLLGLLENPNLLEHESFTDLLWAVFHLTEELCARDGFDGLPASDVQHVKGDVERVYGRLVRRWLAYMMHLQNSYPYLFSLALRSNPFDAAATPVVS